MSILDKLLEKKDILAYIQFRTSILEKELEKVLISTPDNDKQFIKKQFDGRILELKQLRTTVEHGMLKMKSISYSRKVKMMTLAAKIRQEEHTAECDNCHGKGWHDYDGDKLDDEGSEKCCKCNGTGRISMDNKV
jgi:DnaJ-class molecular chaperone